MLASLDAKQIRVLQKLHSKVIPSLILAGINYDFGEGRPAGKGPVLDNKSIENIRKILGDLSGMYRGSRRRFVPDYAHYYQRNKEIFKKPVDIVAMDEDLSPVVSPITGGAGSSATAFDNPDVIVPMEPASEAEQPMEEPMVGKTPPPNVDAGSQGEEIGEDVKQASGQKRTLPLSARIRRSLKDK